jgi:murein DD-endopeptidase MepM/ murein hydrolase activator NlpD
MPRVKRILTMLLFMAILFSYSLYTAPEEPADARTIAQVENDIKECQKLIESLQNEQKSISSEISKINSQSKVTTETLNTYIKEIDSLNTEIDLTQATIETYSLKIADLESDITLKNENLEYYNRLYDSIVLYSFKQGDVSLLEILFEAESFTDFLTRLDNINYFLTYTDTVKTSIRKARTELEDAQEKLKASKAELEAHVAELEAKKKTASQKKAEFETKAKTLGMSLKDFEGKSASTSTAIQQAKAKLTALEKELKELRAVSAKNYIWPLPEGTKYSISSGYGTRIDPFTKRPATHLGIDIACAQGTPILAANGGYVTRSEDTGPYSYGEVIFILHSDGMTTLYAHCSKRVVKKGDTVQQGQIIGYVGSTGRSTGPHLHYSVLKGNDFVNPLPNYLPSSKVK